MPSCALLPRSNAAFPAMDRKTVQGATELKRAHRAHVRQFSARGFRKLALYGCKRATGQTSAFTPVELKTVPCHRFIIFQLPSFQTTFPTSFRVKRTAEFPHDNGKLVYGCLEII